MTNLPPRMNLLPAPSGDDRRRAPSLRRKIRAERKPALPVGPKQVILNAKDRALLEGHFPKHWELLPGQAALLHAATEQPREGENPVTLPIKKPSRQARAVFAALFGSHQRVRLLRSAYDKERIAKIRGKVEPKAPGALAVRTPKDHSTMQVFSQIDAAIKPTIDELAAARQRIAELEASQAKLARDLARRVFSVLYSRTVKDDLLFKIPALRTYLELPPA